VSSRARAALLPAPLGRAGRLLVALLLACGVVLTTLALGTRPAYAATADQIDDFEITYDVRPSGVVRVVETITYRFGTSSGRHGIERQLVTREPYDDEQDAVYTISDVDVSSPDPGISTNVDRTDSDSQDGRVVTTTLRIGDADETVSAPTATYVIAYDLAGAMRSFPNAQPAYDEFYWDATGLDWRASIARVAIDVTVPGGVQETTCTYGAVGSKTTCTQSIDQGVAKFSQTGLAAREGVTIGNKIKPGLLAVSTPDLEPRADRLSGPAKAAAIGAGVAVGGAAIASPLLGAAYYRRNGRDQRFAGMPPGTFPVGDQQVATELSDPDMQIPVAFVPPKIPVAEAGMLVDGQIDTKETAATLVDLAVRGGLRIISESKDDVRVELRDPNVATAPHEMRLLNGIFRGDPPGTVVDLGSQGSMLKAHQDMDAAVRQQVAARGWFTRVPGKKTTTSLGFAVVALSIFGIAHAGLWALLLAAALLPVVITVAVVKHKMRRGQRTPEGRAWTDQVEGFQKYLATAEADQLRFEEGEDIFSRYLPWAIVFGLADRWAKVCGDLVAMGRVPDYVPYWYYGNLNLASFNTGFLTGALSSAATPVPSASSSSGTGFGGGSSFSGGGFSGGGGGGGGGGSW